MGKKQTRAALKAYFQKGDKPTEAQFAELIDSMVNFEDDEIEKLQKGQPLKVTGGLEVVGDIKASGFEGSGRLLTDLDASQIVAGTLSVDRIPDLDASKINLTFALNNSITLIDFFQAILFRKLDGEEKRFLISDKNDKVVLDLATRLMWLKDANHFEITMNWFDAIESCTELKVGGFNDWRLPQKEELQSLLRFINHHSNPFLNVHREFYWSSTEMNNTNNVYIDSIRGRSNSRKDTTTHGVWPVRSLTAI
jgi:hypothetical protein